MAKVSFVRGTDAQIEELEVTEGQIIVSESGALYVDADTERIPISASEETIVAVYDTTTATSAHAVDSYVYVNNYLYVVTVAIAVGDTIAVGTNVALATNLDANTPVYISGLPSSSGGDGGIPEGGTTGQVLVKLSNSDYDVGWGNATGGGVGTVVNLVTTTPSFHNKTVTLTGTYATYSTTFDNTGHASVNVYYVGTYDIACEGFHNSVNVTAMGLVLTQGIDEDYCTVNLSTSDSALEGATCTIYFGDPTDEDVRQVTVVDSTLAFSFRATQIGSYTMLTQFSGTSTKIPTTFTVSSLSGSMNVTIQSIPLKTFAAATDEEIVLMVQAADNGYIDLYDDCGWRVGQTRVISVSAINSSGTYDGVSWSVGENQAQQTRTIILVESENTYDLVTPVLNKDGTTRNKCSFIYAFTTFQSKGYFHSSCPYPSWNSSARRGWCNGGLRGSIPSYLRNISKKVYVKTADSYSASALTTTQDYFTMPSGTELTNAPNAHSLEKSALSQFAYNQTRANLSNYGRGTIGASWALSFTWLMTRSLSCWSASNFNFICCYDSRHADATSEGTHVNGAYSGSTVSTAENSIDIAPIGFI